MTIYVSNLSFTIDSEQLRKLFSPYGIVSSVNIILDKLTNRSKGFAFVQMRNSESAAKAVRELNGSRLDGQFVRIMEAKRNERY